MRHHLVFGYGSNMHLEDLRRWLAERDFDPSGVLAARPAMLRDYRLVWNYSSPTRGGGAANVEPAPGEIVYGVALEVDEATLAGIDRKEGAPTRYSRGDELRGIELLEGGAAARRAWLYEVQPAYRRTPPVRPRRHYLHLMIEGARRLELPDWYVARLERVETLD